MLRLPKLAAWALLLTLPALSATAGSGNIFVSSEKDDAIAVLDGTSYEVIKTIATSERPRHMQFSHDRKLIYAACGEGESIDIIDVAEAPDLLQGGDVDDVDALALAAGGVDQLAVVAELHVPRPLGGGDGLDHLVGVAVEHGDGIVFFAADEDVAAAGGGWQRRQ